MYENNHSITMIPVATAVPQKRFVSVTTGAEVALTGSAADALGVSLEASAADTQIAIPVGLLDGGKQEVESGAAITIGARVMSDATGRAITATGATARVLGWALSTSAAAGEIVTIAGRPASGEFVA
jgi:hypothetical protein